MLREGARVLAIGIDVERGGALCASLADRGQQRILFARSDVRQEADWESAIELATERLGPLDVLVNNADRGAAGTQDLPRRDTSSAGRSGEVGDNDHCEQRTKNKYCEMHPSGSSLLGFRHCCG